MDEHVFLEKYVDFIMTECYHSYVVLFLFFSFMSISKSFYATVAGLLVVQNTFGAADAGTYFGASKATAIAGWQGASTPYQAITNIIVALLSLITLVAVAYVLYAGFQILTAWGDEEKVKSGRKTIINVIIGIIIMWLAYWIVTLVLNALV